MTNSSTVVTALRGLETRSLRCEKDSGVSRGDCKEHTDDSMEQDVALAEAEENLMLEDEEISSHDGDGNPIVDTEKLEKRMLTVAIVKSVVETSGGGETPQQQQHRYGLRKRRRPSDKANQGSPRSVDGGGRDTQSNGSGSPRWTGGTRSSPAASPRTTRSNVKVKEEEVETEKAKPSTLVPPTVPAVKVVRPAPHPVKVERRAPQPIVASVKVKEPTPMKCTNVPNPLANSTPSPVEPKPVITMAIKKEEHNQQGSSATGRNGAHIALAPAVGTSQPAAASAPPPVACPLPPASAKENVQSGQAAQMSSAAVDARARRGRIFSIDIDPAGLDFPDLGIVDTMNQQSDLSKASPLPPISATTSGGSQVPIANVAPPQVPQDKIVGFSADPITTKHPAAAEADAVIVGRDRAMSFEFFSFGLNHDEPLPPAPDLSAAAVEKLGRPRGDSIIFDPCSFRDGGILEESGLFKSRGNSIDITGDEEVAIMSEPGFAPAPTTIAHVESQTRSSSTQQTHAPRPDQTTSIGPSCLYSTTQTTTQPATATLTKSSSSSQMATLPSSLSGSSVSHSTFQMELLNKDGRIGIYLPEARKERIAKFHSKRKMRIWRKRIKYDCRKKLADSRPRIKGRFVKRSDMEED